MRPPIHMNNWLACLTLGYLMSLGNPVTAQTLDVESSFQKASEIIEQSLEAYGGRERIEAIRRLSLNIEGEQFWGPELSNTVIAPFLVTPKGYRILMDREQGSFYHEFSGQYGGYNNWKYYQFQKGHDEPGFSIGTEGFDCGWFQHIDNTSEDGSRYFKRWFTPYVALDAADNIEGAQWQGTVNIDGQPNDHLVLADKSGLYIDQKSHFITKTESFGRPHPLKGDVLTERYYKLHITAKGLFFASEVTHIQAGDVIDLLKIEAEIDEPIDSSFMMKPEHYRLRPDVFPTGEASIKKVAEGIYVVEVGPNAYMGVIEFDDFIAIIWSPFNPDFTKGGIDLIKKTIPHKEIKYLGQTHHWWDSSGGLVAGIDAGATVITTAGNKAYFTQMASAMHTAYDYAPTFTANEIKFEMVEDKISISDGKRDLIVYRKHPEKGVNDVLLFYVPDQKALFSSHFFEAIVDPETAVADEGTVWAYKHLAEMGLDVDIVTHYNGGSGHWSDVKKSIKRRKKWDKRHSK